MNARKRITAIWILSTLLLTGCAAGAGGAAPAATAAPLPDPGSFDADVRALLAGMTLEQKVCQLFFVRPEALDPGRSAADGADAPGVQRVTEEIRSMLARFPVGGVVIFGRNISSPEQLTDFLAALQSASQTPLFLAVDEEGGSVSRLAGEARFRLPRYESAAAVGAGGDPAAAEEMGRTIGAYLKRYGFSMDFAPVADVMTNPDNPVIGDRAFSGDPDVVSAMAAAMAGGLLESGIIPVYKHFPGHGDTREDSHLALAVTRKSYEELVACEWLPYLRGDLTRCGVMVGHIAVPAVTGDMLPASMSEILVNGVLRSELGFDGLVITDSLAMGAVAAAYTPGEAAVNALLAGCDVLLIPEDLPAACAAVLRAVRDGELTEERIDLSVSRILRYKALAGLL